MISIDIRALHNKDLVQLRYLYAMLQADETTAPRLRMFFWNMCLALGDELEDRYEAESLIADALDDAGNVGEQLVDPVADEYWSKHDADEEKKSDPRNDPIE